jgi:hypothetical protein
MICAGCGSHLGHINKDGEPIVRNRGLVFKASGVIMVCPKCKRDVPLTADFAKALTDRLILFIRRPQKAAPEVGTKLVVTE